MQFVSSFGDHKVYNADTLPFIDFLQNLYNTNELGNVFSQDYQDFKDGKKNTLEDLETDIHKKFYHEIKTNDTFKKLYCSFIKEIYNEFFSDEPCLIYQSYPSIRFQFPGNVAVPPHCDSDDIGKHPIGEQNFLIPITKMTNTTRLFVESSPGKADFQGIDLEPGNLLFFNGNKCIHYNQTNQEDYIRVSFDFRVLVKKDYMTYINGPITTTNPRDPDKTRKPTKMIIGGYYQVTRKNDSLEKMMNWHHIKEPICQSRPLFGEEEKNAVHNYMSGDNFMTEHKKTKELEEMIAKFSGSKYCSMVTSGSSALVTALLACGIKQGDDVIVPDYTMVATANAVQLVGANVVLVDVDPKTYTLSLDIVKNSITAKTKAVMYVSLNNQYKDLREISQFCKESNIYLIEDAAQSVGCFVDGKHFGTFGDVGIFSYSTPKIISMGQGGALITGNDEIYNNIQRIKNFGRDPTNMNEYKTFGLNFKFTDLQAVIGIEQMKKLPERITRYKEISKQYDSILPFSGWFPWFIETISDNRDQLMHFLKQHNIETRPTYPSLHTLNHLKQDGEFPNSLYISKKGLFLPTHMLLTDPQISYIQDLLLF